MPESIVLMALFGGFVGSVHCIGMCGGFVCGLSRAATSSKRLLVLKNLFYNAGRLTTYTFIGAVVSLGALGLTGSSSQPGAENTAIEESSQVVGALFLGSTNVWQQMLSIVAGVLMLLMALQLLGVRRRVRPSWGKFGGTTMATMLQTLVRSNRPEASVALGVVNGFLPCPLVLSFAAIAATRASVIEGMLVMFAFGLGTFPAMLFMGSVGGIVGPSIRQTGARVSGVLLIVLAVFTIIRGVLPMASHGTHNMNAFHHTVDDIG